MAVVVVQGIGVVQLEPFGYIDGGVVPGYVLDGYTPCGCEYGAIVGDVLKTLPVAPG